MADSIVGTLRAILSLDTAQFQAGAKKGVSAATELEKTLAKLGDGSGRLTAQAERMVKSLSGDKLLSSAHNLTAAVLKIGGASKLTEAEQARVNKTLGEAIQKYNALGEKGPADMRALEQATRRVEPPTSMLTTKMVALGSAVGSFIGNIASNAVQRLGQELVQAAADGAKLTAITAGFQRLAAGIGQSGDAMLMVTRGATKGLISDLDLMQSTNKAILLGLPVTAAEMGTLSKAAITLGRAMGLDATQALDNLVTALGRTSPLILDNLGLTVKVGEANEAYARSLGKLPSQLTDAEQKMAFYRAAMDAALRKTEELGEIQLGVVDQLTRLGTTVANTATQMVSGANESRTFAGVLGILADAAGQAAQRMLDLAEARRRLGATTGDPLLDFIGPRNPLTGVGGVFDIGTRLGIGSFAREAERIEAARLLAMAQGRAPELKPRPEMFGPKPPTAAELKALDDASEKLQKRFAEMVALGNSLFGRDLIQRANDLVSVLGGVGNVSKLTEEKQKELNAAVTAAIGVYESLGQTAPAQLRAVRDATTALLTSTSHFGLAMRATVPNVKSGAESVNADLIPSLHGLEAAFDATARAKANFDALMRVGMIAPGVVGGEDPTGEARRIADAALDERLREQRDHIIEFWKRQIGQLEGATLGRIGTLFFGNLGHDVTGELKSAADEAELEFLRLQRSGRATAKELQVAFARWREAEDRANFSFGERWKQFWGGIKQTFVSVLDDMLQHFLKQFLGGMLRGMASARLGQSAAGLLIPGIGGGAGAFGIGAAGAAVPTGITAPGGMAAGGAGGAGFLSNPAFWTNPYTIGVIASAAILTWGIKKKGWFRGGEEGVQVNPKRDQFLAQFGGHHMLAAILTRKGAGEGGGSLMQRLNAADSLKDFRGVQSSIAGFLAPMRVKQFNFGGFVPPNVTQPAILHGGAFGEDITPRTRPNPQAERNVHVQFTINAVDARGVRDLVRSRDFLDSIAHVFEFNTGFVTTRVKPSLR